MKKILALILLLICTATSILIAEDPRERQYFTPALKPKHKDKPEVSGWAQKRIEEKLNRGLLAIPNKEGQVYLGWRLLKSDARGTAFNVYRCLEGGASTKLNKEPVIATTDFIDTQPHSGGESTYWVRPVINGKELEPSEKVLLSANAKDKEYYSSIKFQGNYRPQRIAVNVSSPVVTSRATLRRLWEAGPNLTSPRREGIRRLRINRVAPEMVPRAARKKTILISGPKASRVSGKRPRRARIKPRRMSLIPSE